MQLAYLILEVYAVPTLYRRSVDTCDHRYIVAVRLIHRKMQGSRNDLTSIDGDGLEQK